MKRIITLLFLFVALITDASTPLDNRSRAFLDQIKQSAQNDVLLGKGLKSATDVGGTADSLYYSVIMKLSNNSVIDELISLGTVIFHQRENFLLASIPYSQLDSVSRLPLINKMSLSEPMSLTLDSARAMTNVNVIKQGINLPKSYDGKGVVVGFSDIGFDPSHPNFTDGRLSRMVHYDALHAKKYDMTIPQQIFGYIDTTEWHATHVAGILAGGYKGLPYLGVAPGAEIVATTSSLYDMAILAGAEDVVEYAKSVGKPAVINMSVGYYLGPHDGSGLFNQYLDLIGEEAIVCLSAGNEGNKRVYIPFDAVNDGDEMKTFVYDNPHVNGIELRGAIDLWSIDEGEFLMALTIYDRITKEFVYTSPFVGSVNGGATSWGIASSTCATENDISIPVFESELTGAVRIYSSLNIENNRYNVYATVDVKNNQLDSTGRLGRYCIGFITKAQAGMHIDAYADGSRLIFNSLGIDGFINGTSDRSISDLACGKNVIVVGASNSRNVTPQIAGNEVTYSFDVGKTSFFSSYGTLDDGRSLPHFCAPGNMVVSSMNTHYANRLSESEKSTLAAKTTIDGKDFYWVSECGTSMSSPHAAGIIACWLQADSMLTVHDVIDIAQSTANADFIDFPNRQWGAGNIDAYAGLKEVLTRGGVGNVLADNSYNVILRSIGYRQIEIEIPNSHLKEVEIFSMSGQLVYIADTNIIDVSSLSSGVYIIKVMHTKGESIERILIK